VAEESTEPVMSELFGLRSANSRPGQKHTNPLPENFRKMGETGQIQVQKALNKNTQNGQEAQVQTVINSEKNAQLLQNKIGNMALRNIISVNVLECSQEKSSKSISPKPGLLYE
jgi:hypothetical protein